MEYPLEKDKNPHVCKICSRKFGCGKALGGHMRIHGSYDSPVLHQRNKKRKVSEIGSTSYDYRDIIMGHVESNLDCGEIEEQVIDQYENDPTSKSGGLRSKSSGFVGESHEEALSMSLSKADEDLAICLMMLSAAQGSWRPTKSKDPRDNDNSLSNDIFGAEKKSSYECKTCKKVFSSHQALGGHRASHKKMKNSQEMNTGSESCHTSDQASDESVHVRKKHECVVCHRNFGSGQALGGHKRCHGVSNDGDSNTSCGVRTPSPKPSTMQKKTMFLLDLNKPAPLEDEDDDHVDFYNLPNCDNKVSYYSQPQWWTENPYRVYPKTP